VPALFPLGVAPYTANFHDEEATVIDCETERPNEFRQVLHVREHLFHADVAADSGSIDSAPVVEIRSIRCDT